MEVFASFYNVLYCFLEKNFYLIKFDIFIIKFDICYFLVL